MMKRLWHVLVVGHDWKLMSVCLHSAFSGMLPINAEKPMSEDIRFLVFGSTTTFEECRCGARRETRILGHHKLAGEPVDAELEQLRKML